MLVFFQSSFCTLAFLIIRFSIRFIFCFVLYLFVCILLLFVCGFFFVACSFSIVATCFCGFFFVACTFSIVATCFNLVIFFFCRHLRQHHFEYYLARCRRHLHLHLCLRRGFSSGYHRWFQRVGRFQRMYLQSFLPQIVLIQPFLLHLYLYLYHPHCFHPDLPLLLVLV